MGGECARIYVPSLNYAEVVEEPPNVALELGQDAVAEVLTLTSSTGRCEAFLVFLILRGLSIYIKHFQ